MAKYHLTIDERWPDYNLIPVGQSVRNEAVRNVIELDPAAYDEFIRVRGQYEYWMDRLESLDPRERR